MTLQSGGKRDRQTKKDIYKIIRKIDRIDNN